MVRLSSVVVVLTLALLGVGGLLAQDSKSKDSASKVKGQLPQNWSKLGLSDEQRQKVYMVQSEYKEKVEALEKQLTELKKKQMDEMTKVLTASQKSKLREILNEKIGGDDTSKKSPEKP